jgi:hypothetical protein
MSVVTVASVHDCGIVIASLLSFYTLGNMFLYGQSIYGLGKFHDNNPSQFSQLSNFVFAMTLMTGCAMLEVRHDTRYEQAYHSRSQV